MTRYLISDHHFGHPRIIDYCDRPFTSVGDMDSAMLDHHYQTVGPDDVLIHLGDVAMDMRDGAETIERFQQIGGDLLVKGNHDVGLTPDSAPFPVVDSCLIEHGDYQFCCVHRPKDVPDEWDGWTIHGHHHDNDLDAYPFVAYDARRINVAVEVLDYEPIGLDELVAILEECMSGDHLRRRTDVQG